MLLADIGDVTDGVEGSVDRGSRGAVDEERQMAFGGKDKFYLQLEKTKDFLS